MQYLKVESCHNGHDMSKIGAAYDQTDNTVVIFDGPGTASAIGYVEIPTKRGHWICCGQDDTSDVFRNTIQDYVNHGGKPEEWRPETFYCSSCLKAFSLIDNFDLFIKIPNYCPNCGAKMSQIGCISF